MLPWVSKTSLTCSWVRWLSSKYKGAITGATQAPENPHHTSVHRDLADFHIQHPTEEAIPLKQTNKESNLRELAHWIF